MTRVEVPIQVRYAEVDRMGAAHHSAYFVWFELARSELLRSIGVPYASLEDEGVLFPVVDVEMRYRAPARYDDEVIAETAVTRVSFVRVSFSFALRDRRGGTLLAEGASVHACIDADGKLRRIPSDLRSRLAE